MKIAVETESAEKGSLEEAKRVLASIEAEEEEEQQQQSSDTHEGRAVTVTVPTGAPGTLSIKDLARKRVEFVREWFFDDTNFFEPPAEEYCCERYEDYSASANDRRRVYDKVHKLVSEGKLIRGKSNPKVNIDTVAALTISIGIFQTAELGTHSWDLTIYDALVVNLYRVFTVRAGDIANSEGYFRDDDIDLSLHWSDMNIFVECPDNEEPKPKHVRGIINLRYTKNHKKDKCVVQISNSMDGSPGYSCILQLAIIHCARNGLVEGSTVQEILRNARDNPRKQIIWKYPDYPVVCLKNRETVKRCLDLDKPAGTSEVLGYLNRCSEAEGMQGRATLHGMRAGGAKDTGKLRQAQVDGKMANEDALMEVTGNGNQSLASGASQQRLNKNNVDYNLERHKVATIDFQTPKFVAQTAQSLRKSTKREVSDFMRDQGYSEEDIGSRKSRRLASNALRKSRLAKHSKDCQSAMPTAADPVTGVARYPLQLRDTNEDGRISRRPIDNPGNSEGGEYAEAAGWVVHEGLGNEVEMNDQIAIDENDDAWIKFVEVTHCDDPIEFMSKYMKVNDYKKDALTRLLRKDPKTREEVLSKHACIGNSRDPPSIFTPGGRGPLECQFGCGATFVSESGLQKHQQNCKNNTALIPCPKDGCNKAFLTKILLLTHIRNAEGHEEVVSDGNRKPQKAYCDICDKKVIRRSWAQHMFNHSGKKLSCLLCPFSTSSLGSLREHVGKNSPHSSPDDEPKKRATREQANKVVNDCGMEHSRDPKSELSQPCAAEGCNFNFEPKHRAQYSLHLIRIHKFSKDEAAEQNRQQFGPTKEDKRQAAREKKKRSSK
ncbi:hypothetical protein TRICI_006114 [Trichomonascus ciferrii]|uniref:C2H2-type domain-containing protein n=1 Tax=Trichomonascus ciferrii TaxID=44093 RepID=A0A642UKD1_9ASCO|nr:hypothetical protein TRICI_006114 [Trichomonascus ciferrii]